MDATQLHSAVSNTGMDATQLYQNTGTDATQLYQTLEWMPLSSTKLHSAVSKHWNGCHSAVSKHLTPEAQMLFSAIRLLHEIHHRHKMCYLITTQRNTSQGE